MCSASRTGAEDLAPLNGQPGSVTASQDAYLRVRRGRQRPAPREGAVNMPGLPPSCGVDHIVVHGLPWGSGAWPRPGVASAGAPRWTGLDAGGTLGRGPARSLTPGSGGAC